MKRILLITIIGVLAFSLFGCKNSKDITSETQVTTSEKEVVETEEIAEEEDALDLESTVQNEETSTVNSSDSMFDYEIIDNEAYIYDYLEKHENEIVQIPDEIEGYPVVGIGTGEFTFKVFSQDEALKEIILPDTLKSIGKQVFYDCTNLEKVTFGNSLEEIWDEAFMQCSSLKEVSFPEGFLSLGQDAFSFCSSLETVFLPESLEVIEQGNFAMCHSDIVITAAEGSAGEQYVLEKAENYGLTYESR